MMQTLRKKISIILLFSLLLLTVACGTTKTIVFDDKDDYIECVHQGLKDFRFSSGGHSGSDVRKEFNAYFKIYSDKVLDNCMKIYNNHKN